MQNDHEEPRSNDGENASGNDAPVCLLRLHRALSATAQRRRSSYESALKLALREVEENDDLTEKEILEKLATDSYNPVEATSTLGVCESNAIHGSNKRNSNWHNPTSSGLFTAEPVIPRIDVGQDDADESNSRSEDNSSHPYGLSGETDDCLSGEQEASSTEEDNGSYRKLCAIVQALSDGGRSGFEALRGGFEQENLQFGFDKVFTHVLHTFHDQWSYMFEYLFPWQQLQAMLLVFCLQLINVHQVIKCLPVVSCYISFLIMIYYTLKLIHSRYWMKQAKLWRRLLRVFQFTSRTPTAAQPRQPSFRLPTDEHQLDGLDEPYGHFFLAVVLFIFSFSLTDPRTMYNVFPMCALSVFFSFICFISLLEKRHYYWAKVVMAADVFTSLPFIFKRVLGRRLGSVFGNVVNLRIGALKLGLGLSSVAEACIFALYVYAAVFSTTKSSVRLMVLPHLVCFSWWHVGLELMISSNCWLEWRHTVLTLIIVWMILYPSWTAASACVLVAAMQAKASLDPIDMLKCLSIGFIFCLPYAYKRLVKHLGNGSWSGLSFWEGNRWKVILSYSMLAMFLTAILYGGRESPDMLKRKISNLTWSEFHQQCSSFNTDRHRGNLLQQQIACSEFGSTVIEWSGVVDTIRIVNIENLLESIFYYLPESLAQNLRCLYGSKTDAFNGTTSTRKRCSVRQYNVYTFEFDVRGPWTREFFGDGKVPEKTGSSVAVVQASDVFEGIAMELQRGDVINFTAILDDDILNYPTKLDLLQIECMKCPRLFANKRATRVVSEAFYSEDHWFWTKLYNACRAVFNFVFAPLLIID